MTAICQRLPALEKDFFRLECIFDRDWPERTLSLAGRPESGR